MSVARAREFVARARAAGIVVHELDGCYSRGNGQASAYGGWVNHHTATAYGMAPRVLWEGRPDLAPPLCNTAGNVDGSVTLVAAHPANHAGASGGWDTRPLPITNLFNKLVWGHEIVYPGTQPMTNAQYRTALIVSKIGVDIWGYGDVNRIKFHQGTSITGKWDPGYAPSKTVDIGSFRASARTILEDDMQADERNALLSIYNALFKNNAGETEHVTQGDQSIITRLVELQVNTRALVSRPGADVDEVALATALAPLLPNVMNQVSDDDLARIAVAVNDELHRRQAA